MRSNNRGDDFSIHIIGDLIMPQISNYPNQKPGLNYMNR